MPQDVKSPITYPVRKPVGNIQADNPAKVSHWQKKKKSDFSIEAKQTTQK